MRRLGWGLAALSVAVLVVACAVIGKGVDAPRDIDTAYAARERAMMQDSDRCGPASITDKLPDGFANVVGVITDGPFRPVCRRHDACYRLGEKDQTWCDERMRDEMRGICETGKATPAYSAPIIGRSLCLFHAGLYHAAIDSTLSSPAYGGLPGGEITALRTKVIDDRLTDDEFTVCVDVTNPTRLIQEYDVEMHDAGGRLIDREPDLREINVRPGETKEFCVTTNFTTYGISDLSDIVHVSVRADTPENFAFLNDMVIVDTREVRVR